MDKVKEYFISNIDDYSAYSKMGPVTSDGMMTINEHKIILTYLQHILDNNIEGDIVEFGCYGGGTSVAIKKLLKANNSNKKLYVYDSFEGLPENHENDKIATNTKGTMVSSLQTYKDKIEKNNCKDINITKGFFKDIKESELPEKISFAFYDGDLYQSTLDFLNKVEGKMSKGSIIIFDDFVHPQGIFPGTKVACNEYFKSNNAVTFLGDTHLLGSKDNFYYVDSSSVSQGIYEITKQ
jgi:O-methyltransferase